MILNVNSDAAVKFTNTLEKMHRSALPNAVRATLNSLAFDVKKNTMPAKAEQTFTQRVPNFFKANSRVDMAKGWNVDQMQATVGFMGGRSEGSDQAVKELEQQEYGGTIASRSFIPLTSARGGSSSKKVAPRNRLSRIQRVVNAATMQGKSPAQQFRHAVGRAGAGGYVIGNNANRTLFKVESISRSGYKLKPLYSYRENRTVRVNGTGFMRAASLESAPKGERFYQQEAKKQIERLNK